MMGDYISREAALNRFEQLKEQADTMRDKIYLDGVLAVIDTLPSSDVRPVVHGKWIKERTMNGLHYVKCDKCGYKEYDHIKYTKFNFCPECGADMR